jgi:hypothetical protein
VRKSLDRALVWGYNNEVSTQFGNPTLPRSEGALEGMAAPQPVLIEESVYGGSRATLEVSIRELAHSLRQPLGAIEAIAYYLEMTLPAEQIEARGHLLRLQRLVEESNTILQDGIRDLIRIA